MKIIDNTAPPAPYTLDDAQPGETVRLKNGRVYLIGYASTNSPLPARWTSHRAPPDKLLINLETGATHVIKSGVRTEATALKAVVEVS